METERKLTRQQVAETRRRRLVAQQLQAIEGNPLTAEDIAMFEMFEREGWSHGRRLAYILDEARRHAVAPAEE